MSDMKMYNILGHFNNLEPKLTPVTEADMPEAVYESVEPRGDIMEAVKSLEEKFMSFGNTVEEGKKLKDKAQFDATAETGDYYLTDKGNKVVKTSTGIKHEKQYAGDTDKDDLDEAMFPGSGIGKSLRGADQGLRYHSDAIKAGAVGAVASGAGAGLGAAAQTSMATGAAALFAPAMGAGMLIGASAVLGTALTYKALQWVARKLFGTTEEALEFAKAHLSAAQAGQPQFQFQGKNYPVKVKPDQVQDLKDEITQLGMRSPQKQGTYESAKPDFLDVDKDGDKKEPFKKAVKDKEQVDELVRVKPQGNMISKDFNGYDTEGQRRNTARSVKLARSQNRAGGGPTKGAASGEYDGAGSRTVSTYNNPLTKAFARKGPQGKTVDEATEFGDTIKNSAGKMTKAKVAVKEGKDAIRNHPIYTTKEAWDHYSQELAEQETLDGVRDVQQELDEIAALAGLKNETSAIVPADSDSPLTHAGCGICNETPCSCSSVDEAQITEAATRKDFRMVADLIKQIPDADKRKELAHHHSDIFKQQNPRFKHDVFCKACGVDECDYNMGAQPTAVIVGEETCPTCDCAPCKCDEGMMEAEMEEGNEFSGALAAAKASGKKTFTVGDGDNKQTYTVKEDINVNVTASGEEDVVNLIRKLSGMPVVAVQAQPEVAVAEEVVEEDGEVSGKEPREIEHLNTPREQTAATDITTKSGTGYDREKKQYRKEYPGDNPMQASDGTQVQEETLWTAYEDMIKEIKA